MPRRKLEVITPGDEPYKIIVTGGPKKYFNRRRVRDPLARKPIYGYQPVDAKWFGELVKELRRTRQRRKMSQAAMANILGTSQAELSRFEAGKTNPTIEFLDRVSRVLEVRLRITKEKSS